MISRAPALLGSVGTYDPAMKNGEQPVGNWIRIDGAYLDIPSRDVSAFEPDIKRYIGSGGGWIRTQNGVTPGFEQHWVGAELSGHDPLRGATAAVWCCRQKFTSSSAGGFCALICAASIRFAAMWPRHDWYAQ